MSLKQTISIQEHFNALMRKRGADVSFERFEAASVDNDGIKLHLDVIELGVRRPTVVFLPGTIVYSLIYGNFLASLADQGLNVVGVDFRGHGRSEGMPGSYTIPELVSDARAAIRYARQRFQSPVTVVGSNQGGILALYTAATDEELLGAVCHNAADLSDPRNADLTANPRLTRSIIPVLKIAATLFPYLGLETQRYLNLITKDYNEMKAMVAEDPFTLKIVRLRALASLATAKPARSLEEVTTPVLLLRGSEDRMFGETFTHQVFQRLGCEKSMKIYQGAGHFLCTERPQEVSRDIAKWVEMRAESKHQIIN